MNSLKTLLGFDTSDKAKTRLHILEVFYKKGWSGVSTAFPHLSRPTLYRWKKEFEDSRKSLESLVPHTTRPHKTRTMHTDERVIALIKHLRQTYPRLGKCKLHKFVYTLCVELDIPPISTTTIGKIIRRNHFFYAKKKKQIKKPRTDAQKIRLCPQAKDNKPGYLQLDGVKFFSDGQYYYFLTAVDIVSKQAWLKLVRRLNSHEAQSFLTELLTHAYYSVHTVQTDNGSEFKSVFDQAIQQLAITRILSYPRHPKTNGFVERFNWTIQDEFLHQYEDLLEHRKLFQDKLTEWLVYYNTIRPHQHLDYKTPLEFAQQNGGVVSNVCV